MAAGGIGAYGSDESEDERSVRGSDSASDTDEEELRHRIRLKQDAFRRKEQERQELEEHVVSNPGKASYTQCTCCPSETPLTSSRFVCPFSHSPPCLPL